MLCNAIIQSHFDYACPAWRPNIIKKTRNEIKVMQNRCIWRWLRIEKIHHVSLTEFRSTNWLPTN